MPTIFDDITYLDTIEAKTYVGVPTHVFLNLVAENNIPVRIENDTAYYLPADLDPYVVH